VYVYKSNNLSVYLNLLMEHNAGMSYELKKFAAEDMCQRIKRIRIDMGLTRGKLGERIGCSEAQIQQYEERSPLPHRYIARFCLLTGFSPWYLLTGRPDFQTDYENLRKDKDSTNS